MRRIAILNQKGGVGKTTTTVNLASALARRGHRCCIIDLDPQAHATTHLGIEPDGSLASIYDVLVNNRPLSTVRQQVDENLWLVGSDINLAAAEVELAGVIGREVILRDLLAQDDEEMDFIFMDCGPSLGVLTLNALAAAREILIPLQPHFLALHGMGKLFETTALVAQRINPELTITGIVLCLYEAQTRLAQEVAGDLEKYLARSKEESDVTPWAHARLFHTRIRRNIKLAECAGFGQSIFTYQPGCNGAEDYAALAEEVLYGPPKVLSARVSVSDRGSVEVIEPAVSSDSVSSQEQGGG